MATISAAGLGSGLDINGIIDKLLAVERVPVESRLNRQEGELQARLSAFGTVKGALGSFNDTLASLASLAAFQSVSVNSGDDSVLNAVADDSAQQATYGVEVVDLAQAHSLASKNGFASGTSSVGTGTLTFQFGTFTGGVFTANASKAAQSVTIGAEDNSLEGIRQAVNDANIGVTASIINDGSGHRLVFSSDEGGAANSLKITVAEDGGSPTNTDTTGLSQLAFDPEAAVDNGKNMIETVVAQDARVKINGLEITRNTNIISDAIVGVTLTLKKKSASGVSTSISITRDTSAASVAVGKFVSAYNTLTKMLNSVSSYDAQTKVGGILLGDATIRGISNQIRQTLSAVLTNVSGPFDALADIGITTNRDGTMALDKARLQTALENGSDAVGHLFAAAGVPSDALVIFSSATDETVPGTYALNVTTAANRGQYTGALFGYSGSITIDGNNDTFNIKIDGVQSGTITLGQGSYTGSQLAAELQSRINGDSALKTSGVSVLVDFDVSNKFVVTSARYGSASKVEFTSVDTNTAATLGLSVGAGLDGVDVSGTIGGIAAEGSGQFLTGTGAVSGLKIEVLGTTTGSRGTVSFERGIAARLNKVLDEFLDVDGILNVRAEGINDRIDRLDSEREALDRRLLGVEERLRRQFTALDGLLQQLQATSNFLAQQLAQLPTLGPNGT